MFSIFGLLDQHRHESYFFSLRDPYICCNFNVKTYLRFTLACLLFISSCVFVYLLTHTRTHTAAADPEGDDDPVSGLATATARVISTLAKKHVSDVLVPVLIPLKRQLEVYRSPALGHLMAYLTSLYGEHREEVEQALMADKALGAWPCVCMDICTSLFTVANTGI